jgi:copper(I)-binding protein
MRLKAFALIAAACIAIPAGAATAWPAPADLQITDALARPTPPAATVGVVYFSITNRGSQDDQLLSLSTTVADGVEMHETHSVQGMMQMRQVTQVNCPAGASVKAQAGGLHIMLLGLKHPLVEGEQFELLLRFRDAGSLRVPVMVRRGVDG